MRNRAGPSSPNGPLRIRAGALKIPSGTIIATGVRVVMPSCDSISIARFVAGKFAALMIRIPIHASSDSPTTRSGAVRSRVSKCGPFIRGATSFAEIDPRPAAKTNWFVPFFISSGMR